MSKEKTTSGSIGLGTIVFLIFLVMKLGEIGQVAEWSWFWVTSPLWIKQIKIKFYGKVRRTV